MARIQAETNDGAELVAYMLAVLRNPRQPTPFRMAAAQWLADRGFGKAVQTLEADIAVDASVTHHEALRAHVEESDVERLTRALLGRDETGDG